MKITEKTIDAIIENVNNTKRNDYIMGINELIADFVDNNDAVFSSTHFGGTVTPNRVALQQLNSILMPGLNQFHQQVSSRGMIDLYVNAFNRLSKTTDKSCMVRTSDYDNKTTMRACLSPRYNRIDDDVVIESIIDAIGSKSEFSDKFKSIGGNLTDTNTFLKFVSREPVFSIDADGRHRDFSAGLIFSNSETGHGTCQVQVLMIDRYCDNGCIFSSTHIGAFRLVHSGADPSAIGRVGYIAPPQVSNSKLRGLRDHVKGILDAACDRSTFTGYLGMIQDTAHMKIDADDEDGIKSWVDAIGKNFDITETEKKAVVGRLLETGDRSLFGIQAALTDAAKYAESYNRKIELERIGGSMLENIPERWETIRKLVSDL